MKKLFAIGTLLLSSAAVFASPAAYDRNQNYNNQNYNNQNYNNQSFNHGYVAPAPAPTAWNDRARFEREERLRLEARLRRERELRRLRYEHSFWNRW